MLAIFISLSIRQRGLPLRFINTSQARHGHVMDTTQDRGKKRHELMNQMLEGLETGEKK